MNTSNKQLPRGPGRRGFLAMIAALAAAWPFRHWAQPRSEPTRPQRELALHEADFYRPHDLAG